MAAANRRRFLGTVAAGVVGLAVGGGLGWGLRSPETKEVTVTRERTVTAGGGERTVVSTVTSTVRDRQ